MSAAISVSQEILKPHLELQGGHTLSKELRISGAKNSALVLMTAALLTEGALQLCNVPELTGNVPELTDVQGMADILTYLGVQVQRSKETVELHAKGLTDA